ncbi:tRNA-queuosine alpha-mannosyltransferase domain-containing protein [Marinobacterium stanieri]|uniref:tRNA-queuosine alpha-mannosyltransferase domain-containing protein n=1 Tax=Marinobacterium stanieri TaxID=49186 RepID=UPI00025595A8|nr:DUF3524 domain-containing protein [Marinobacterium stanieri]
MRILLLSAYDAMSHRYWRQGLVKAFPEHQWTVLSLPPRYFAWRIRGNSLSWAFNERATLEQPYDLIVATSMVDLTGLKGLVPALANIPTLVYFHENQFAYPESAHAVKSVEPQILNLYNALAADRVVFNSAFNRDTLLQGARKLLHKLPDQVPPNLVALIEQKTEVIPVPLPAEVFCPSKPSTDPLQLVWNHRWEYDKGPELLKAAVEQMLSNNLDFKLHLVGQQFRHTPKVFEDIKQLLEQHQKLGRWGHIESVQEYRALLQGSDAVLSTALHDFQGIAVLEGVAAGCTPVVPDRLAYRELFAAEYRYQEQDEASSLMHKLQHLEALKQAGQSLPCPNIEHLSWDALRPKYAKAFSKSIRQPDG